MKNVVLRKMCFRFLYKFYLKHFSFSEEYSDYDVPMMIIMFMTMMIMIISLFIFGTHVFGKREPADFILCIPFHKAVRK
jgi:hypothetical protein